MNKIFKIIGVAAAFAMLLVPAKAATFDFEEVSAEDGFYIASPQYTDESGEEITKLSPGDTVFVNVKVSKSSPGSLDLCAITSVYDKDDAMLAIECSYRTLSMGDDTKISYCLTLPDELGENCYLKTYVLDSLKGFWSYCRSFTYLKSDCEDVYGWELSGGWNFASDEAHSGHSSLKYNNLFVNADGTAEYGFSTDKNSVYKANFYSKGKALDVTLADDFDETQLYHTPGSDEWELHSFIFDSAGAEDKKIKFTSANFDGSIYIDDLEISDDLVNNGDFEYGTDAWNINDQIAQISTDKASNGSSSLKIKSAAVTEAATAEIDVLPDKTYILSYKSMCSEKTDCFIYDEERNILGQNVKAVKSAQTQWTPNYIVFNSRSSSKIIISFEVPKATSNVSYIDELTLKMLKSGNLVTGGDCEEGSLEAWKLDYSNVSVDAEIDNTVSHSGNSSIRVFNRSVASAPITQHGLSGLFAQSGDGTYRISGWIKPPENTVWTMLKLFTKLGTGSKFETIISLNQNSTGVTDENGFIYIEGDFTVTGTDTFRETYISAYASQPDKDPFWIDDIALYKISD